ncbi:MAG TPA: 50S ribosomal protein L25 [Syntrophales bacterium]|nr:50S ribosomal protein L25 [Syntrophales bacterium]HOD99282.1 50S ribosomal protein L25 [Syntrophales bacterium]HPN08924.1 50S ribosomal protein L25 [Syntrophales bacterium]HPX82287.1 50S ribosomal protein L25 [Syntrophales bacterium]HQB14842.1 50S ribosomal protein L25 [Syntrophales bacterium]
MEAIALRASARKISGKGPARRARAHGLIPAVFYNPKAEAIMLTVSAADMKEFFKKNEDNAFINLRIEVNGTSLERMSIVKDVQRNPLTGQILHIDFYEISMDHKLTADVALQFEGTPMGVELGGELQILKREVSLSCLPSVLPEYINLDISALKIGEALRVKNIPAMEGITILEPDEAILAMVAVTREAMRSESEEEATASKEPEVLKQKAADAE